MKRLGLKNSNKKGEGLRPCKGFTLIEVLIVIVIIGILFTVMFIAVGNTKMKSRNAKRDSDMGQVNKALQIYQNDVGSYPDCDYDGLLGFLVSDYIGGLPEDPIGGEYVYEYSLIVDDYTLTYYTEPDHELRELKP